MRLNVPCTSSSFAITTATASLKQAAFSRPVRTNLGHVVPAYTPRCPGRGTRTSSVLRAPPVQRAVESRSTAGLPQSEVALRAAGERDVHSR